MTEEQKSRALVIWINNLGVMSDASRIYWDGSKEEADTIRAALAPAEVTQTSEPVGYYHEVKYPDKQTHGIFSYSKKSPFGHWIKSYRDKCEFKSMPLYAHPLPSKADALLAALKTANYTYIGSQYVACIDAAIVKEAIQSYEGRND